MSKAVPLPTMRKTHPDICKKKPSSRVYQRSQTCKFVHSSLEEAKHASLCIQAKNMSLHMRAEGMSICVAGFCMQGQAMQESSRGRRVKRWSIPGVKKIKQARPLSLLYKEQPWTLQKHRRRSSKCSARERSLCVVLPANSLSPTLCIISEQEC